MAIATEKDQDGPTHDQHAGKAASYTMVWMSLHHMDGMIFPLIRANIFVGNDFLIKAYLAKVVNGNKCGVWSLEQIY